MDKVLKITGGITLVAVGWLAFIYFVAALTGILGLTNKWDSDEIERFPVCRQVAQVGFWPKVNAIRDLPVAECEKAP